MSVSFSVVTPSFNASNWIRSCVASVADQEGVTVQHVVQDGLSTDGTAEYLASETRIEAESVRDNGMYDAINRGWARCTGEFVLHLNSDEELLPGSLAAVGAYFQAHREVDVVVTGTLICHADGSLMCYRRPTRPTLSILLTSHLPVHTCSTFLRRSSFLDRPWLYDPGFKIVSDGLLMRDTLRGGKRIGVLDRYTSVFLMTGKNMGLTQSETAQREYNHILSLAPPWMTRLTPAIKIKYRLEKLLKGHYTSGPIDYEIYPPGQDGVRKHFHVAKPSGVYRPEQTEAV